MIWRFPVTVQSSKDGDFTYHLVTVALITMLELWLGIIVACVPTLAPLVNRHIKPAVVGVVNKCVRHRTTRRSPYGADKKESDRDAHKLVAIRGSSGRAEVNKTVRSYSDLPDDSSQEIFTAKGHIVHYGDRPSHLPIDLEAGRTGSYLNSNMSPHYGQSRTMITINIVSEPRTTLETRNDQVPQGQIHVERMISTSQH